MEAVGKESEEKIIDIPLSGKYGLGKYTKISFCDYERVFPYSWWLSSENYVKAIINRKQVLLSRFITNAEEGMVADHRNHNTLDNTRNNLRVITQSQNGHNKGKYTNCTSGYKGVHFNKSTAKWIARIQVNNERTYLGSFNTPEEAGAVYEKASKKLVGDFIPTEPILEEVKEKAKLETCQDDKGLFVKFPLTGKYGLGKTTDISLEDLKEVSRYSWQILSENAYPSCTISRKITLLHVFLVNPEPGFVVDHIDHMKLNNRRHNLRQVTASENNFNRGKCSNNVSGVTGVTWMKDRSKWRAQISKDNVRVHLGDYLEKEDAIATRKAAEIKYFGHLLSKDVQSKSKSSVEEDEE
jgi:hypothetical protein